MRQRLLETDLAQVVVPSYSRIAPEKNLGLVVQSFQAIRACVPSARMVWVGAGTAKKADATVTRLIAHLFAAAGLKVGMTNTDGVWVDGHQIDSGDCSGPKSARNVLAHPDTEAAVLETARGGILREGLPGFDDGRAILPADGPRDLVVFTVEAEWSAAVHEFSDGESQGRHRLGFLRSPSMVQDEGEVLPP